MKVNTKFVFIGLAVCMLFIIVYSIANPSGRKEDSTLLAGLTKSGVTEVNQSGTESLDADEDGVIRTDDGYIRTNIPNQVNTSDYPTNYTILMNEQGYTLEEVSKTQSLEKVGGVWMDTNSTFGVWVSDLESIQEGIQPLQKYWKYNRMYSQLYSSLLVGSNSDEKIFELASKLGLPEKLSDLEIEYLTENAITLKSGEGHHDTSVEHTHNVTEYSQLTNRAATEDYNQNGYHDFEDDYIDLQKYLESFDFGKVALAMETLEILKESLPIQANTHDSSKGLNYGFEQIARSDLSDEEVLNIHNALFSERFNAIGVHLAALYQTPFSLYSIESMSSIAALSYSIIIEGTNYLHTLSKSGTNRSDVRKLWQAYNDRYVVFLDEVLDTILSEVRPPKEKMLEFIRKCYEFSSEKNIKDFILEHSNFLTQYSSTWTSDANVDKIRFDILWMRLIYGSINEKGLETLTTFNTSWSEMNQYLTKFTPSMTTEDKDRIKSYLNGSIDERVGVEVDKSESSSAIYRINKSTVFMSFDSEISYAQSMFKGQQEVAALTQADLIEKTLDSMISTVSALRVENDRSHIEALMDRLADMDRTLSNRVAQSRWIYQRDPNIPSDLKVLSEVMNKCYAPLMEVVDSMVRRGKPSDKEFTDTLNKLENLRNNVNFLEEFRKLIHWEERSTMIEEVS